MRLLFLTQDEFPPFRADVVELFARQMPARGHQIDWLMQTAEPLPSESGRVRWQGNTVYLTRIRRSGGFLGRLSANLSAIRGDLRVFPLALTNRYDAIQVRDKVLAGVLALAAARLTGSKFFYWMSYPFAESKLDNVRSGHARHPRLLWLKAHAMRLVLYRLVLRCCDHAFVQSERMRDDCARAGVDAARMTAVPMGIHGARIATADAARAPRRDAPVLLHLGLLMRLRRSEMLVGVLHRVRRWYPDARLVYVGDGQEPADRRAVEDEVRRLGLTGAVDVTGFLPMEEAWERVRQADVCFSPYYPIPVLQSTSPTKLIEYMAMARCIVANHHPEQTPIMAESGVGATVPWGEETFADAVRQLLDHPERARCRASRGPEWVRRHRTYDAIAARVDARYRALLAEPDLRTDA